MQRETVRLAHKVVSRGEILSASRLLVRPLREQLKGYKERKVGALCFPPQSLVPLSPVPVTWELGLWRGCCSAMAPAAEQQLLELLLMRRLTCSPSTACFHFAVTRKSHRFLGALV